MSQRLNDALEKMFDEGQATLPEEDRVWQDGQEMCGAKDQKFTCTKALGHSGDHVAHGWPDGAAEHRWK